MPTTLFKSQAEQFLRRVGEKDASITLGNPTVLPASVQRITIDQIHDYFYYSGLILFRVLSRIAVGEIERLLPNFIVVEENKVLTSGSYTITEPVYVILNPVRIEVTASNWKRGEKIPVSLVDVILSGDRSVSPNYPAYYLEGNSIKVSPSTSLKISFRYIKSIPRLVLSSVLEDIWVSNYSDLLIDGAVMYFKGDSNEAQVENMFYQKLTGKQQMFGYPLKKDNNNITIEQA